MLILTLNDNTQVEVVRSNLLFNISIKPLTVANWFTAMFWYCLGEIILISRQ